jgi:hypothetical protein
LRKKNRYHAINTEKSSKIRKFLNKKAKKKAKGKAHLRHTSLNAKEAV